MNRRDFLASVGAITLFGACGKASAVLPVIEDEKLLLRFAVASDIHYGEANTDYLAQIATLKTQFGKFNNSNPCACFVINGDIIHNDPTFLQPAADALKGIHPKLYVTQGNHDRVSNEVWENTWGCAMNYDVIFDDIALIFGTTSDATGALKCPDINAMEALLEKNKNKKHVFIIWHIHPHYKEMNCTDINGLLSKYPNIRGVFNGHDHNDESVKTIQGIPYLFNGRIAGSWGSFDRNFRIVEVTDKQIVTYLMTPSVKKKQTTLTL